MNDPFEVLDMPRRFLVDEAELQKRYIAASAEAHPDRHTDPVDQADAAERAAVINEAYTTLRDPEARAEALLRLLGGPTKEADKSLPPDLLMEMMEVRETMEAAVESQDQATLQRLRDWARAQRTERLANVAQLLDSAQSADRSDDDLKRVRLELNTLRYFTRMLEQMPEE